MMKRALLAAALLVAAAAGLRPEIFYPWKAVFIGALDAAGWPGLVFAPDADHAFAFLLRVERDGEAAEGADLYDLVSEVGPHSPDGLYARLRLDLGLPFRMGPATPVLMKPAPRRQALTFEWSRRDEGTVIGRVSVPEGVRVTFVHYCPWGRRGDYELLPDGQVRGRSAGTGGPAYLLWTSRRGEAPAAAPGGLALGFEPVSDRTVAFAACVGGGDESLPARIQRFKNAATIAALLEEEAAVYEEKRVKVRGLYAGVPEAISNNLHWALLYQPGSHRLYPPAGRTRMAPGPGGAPDDWTVLGENAFLAALGLGLESQRLAVDAVAAALETQYDDGNVPGWRSRAGGSADRSQPPLGAYVVLKVFERLGDLAFLQRCYPRLRRWHDYWTAPGPAGRPRRDGNGDGLLEWGSDPVPAGPDLPSWERSASGRMKAVRESGQHDLPNWDDAPYSDETGTITLNCVDLSSLYALDAWCLGEIASVLGRSADAERYRAGYERMKTLVNARLWNEREGFYHDRFWDGRFSAHKAASAFFPLLARIPDEGRVQRMLKRLLDPKQFWGDHVIPSVSRDDPSFKPESQLAWRGAVRPWVNYLVYQGLKANRLDPVASEFARKSAEMALRSWKSFGLAPECFDSLTGEAAGERFQTGSALAALTAIEEYLDFTPHEGFRFGMLKPDAKGRLSRVLVQGRHYEVEVSNSSTVLREEGETILAVNGGAVVRSFLYNETEVSFDIKVLDRRSVRLRFLKKGKYQLLVDGREADVFTAAARKFDVPEGEHAVLVQLLEDLEKAPAGGEPGEATEGE